MATHTAGPDSRSRTAGPDSCSHTSGPDSCSHTAGPDSHFDTAGLDSCSHTAGPDSWYEEWIAELNSLASGKHIAGIPPAALAQVDLAAMAAAQPQCRKTMLLQRTTSLNIVPQRISGVLLLCDISLGRPRPVVPACQRRQVFAAIHEGDSPSGISPFHLERHGSRCGRLDKGLPALPEGESDCAASCGGGANPGSRPQVQSHTRGSGRPPAAGHSYIFTAVDRSTRWLEAISLQDMASTLCADALISGWVSRFGVPTIITSDRGAQHTPAIWNSLCSKLGVKQPQRRRTTL